MARHTTLRSRERTDDRRSESRALTAALIEVIAEHGEVKTCVLEDLSPYGACLYSDIALKTGLQVTLRLGSVAHVATVKRCHPRDEGFDIGMEFRGGAWPAPIELPIHRMRTPVDY